MALDIGELVGRLTVDDKGMDKGLKKGESKFKKFGDKLTKLAATGGLAAAVAFGGAILANLNQDAIGAKISAVMGGTAEDAKTYGKLAGQLYAENWGDSVQAIGDTIKAVVSSHLVDPGDTEALTNVTRQAQILADVFGQDVLGSTRAVQQLIKTGLVPDATAGFDLIAAGIQGGLDKSDDLLDTITEYSTQFRELGLDGATAFGLLQQAVNAGARDTDIAADALKEFAIRSKDASTTSIDGFKSLGLNAKQFTEIFAKGGPAATKGLDTVLDRLRAIKDPVEQNRIAVELFGTQSEDLGNALYAMDLDKVSGQFTNVAGAVQKAGDAAGATDAAKLETFKRQAMAAAQSIAADLVPSLAEMGRFAKANASWLKPLVEILGGAAIAIVAINLATKAWAATEAAFTAVKAGATAAQWALNAAMVANPIGLIIVGILLLIGVIVLIATKTTWFQTAWKWAWGGIKAAAMAVWSWIKGTLWPGIRAVLQGIAGVAMWLWHNVFDPVFQGIGAAFAYIMNIANSWANLIKYLFMQTVGAAALWLWHAAIEPAFQGIAAVASWLWSSVILPVSNAIMIGLRAVGAAAMWLWNNAILPAVRGIASAATWLWTNALSPTFSFISTAVTKTGDVIKFVFGKVAGWISSAFSGAVGIVKGALNGVIGLINGAIGGMNSIIGKANSIPGVNFPTIPKIPKLARGGAVSPRAGGTPVVMGDGGEVEYGVPKSDMRQIIADAVRAGGGSSGNLTITLRLIKDGVLKIVRTEVNRKGGNVQKVLSETP